MNPEMVALVLGKVERPVVFYHDHCADGWCSAWLASCRWRDAELIPVQYGAVPPWLRFSYDGPSSNPVSVVTKHEGFVDVKDRHVLIVDFSWNRATLCELQNQARSLLVLDHHASAQRELAGLDFCVFDMGRSGAGLALDHFFPGNRYSGLEASRGDQASWRRHFLATQVEDTDLWKFSFPQSKAVRAALTTVSKTVEAWDSLDVHSLESKGNAILSYQDAMIERIVENAYPIAWEGGEILVANSSVLQSEVGNVLALKAPLPLKTALVWFKNEHGGFNCSLRSVEGGADVSEMAKRRGGGGHLRAAGFGASEAP